MMEYFLFGAVFFSVAVSTLSVWLSMMHIHLQHGTNAKLKKLEDEVKKSVSIL